MDSKLILFSYNSRGFDSDKQFICKYLVQLAGKNIPILCNQENFLLKANSYKVKKCLPDFHIFFKSAIKVNYDGRAKNGMFIAIPNSIIDSVVDVSPDFWRIQAIIIKSDNSNILVINSYFPQDPKTINFDDAELIEILKVISSVIDNNVFSELIWCGDINTNFVRKMGFVD